MALASPKETQKKRTAIHAIHCVKGADDLCRAQRDWTLTEHGFEHECGLQKVRAVEELDPRVPRVLGVVVEHEPIICTNGEEENGKDARLVLQKVRY